MDRTFKDLDIDLASEMSKIAADTRSGLIDQSQKMTTAAMHIAEKNV
jgi:hypothetical protein